MRAGSWPSDGVGPVWLEIIVPARNEAARLAAGLALLCDKAATLPVSVAILVVDSASTDSTPEIVRTWAPGPTPVRLISCDRRGKGRAVRAGLLATSAPFVGFLDADMATDLSALDAVIARLRDGETMVIGSRSHPDSDVEARHSLLRRSGAAVFRGLARTLTDGVRDSQCGFKFFAGPMARAAAAAMTATGFAFDIELIARCQRHGARAVEIPVTWRDMAGSTFSVRRHSLAVFAEIGLIWFALQDFGMRRSIRRRTGDREQRNADGRVRQSSSVEVITAPEERSVVAGRRIAIVNWRDPWHPDTGGAERYAWEMALGLRRRGAGVVFVTARGAGQSRRDRRDEVEIVRLGGRWTVYPRVLLWLAPRRRSFDAVLDCQNGIPFFTPLVLSRRVPVLCLVHHVHDAQFGVHFPAPVAALGRWLESTAARWCYRRNHCVAVSASTARAMRDRLAWTGPIHVVPNGLSSDAVTVPADGPAGTCQDGPGGGQVSLTLVGRLVAHKRAERVLDIADRLAAPWVRIDVIGTGPQLPALAAQVRTRGLGRTVRLHGYLPERDKRALVGRSVLHLNTSQGEGWGLCVIEAAALGIPTVAYDVDGLRDAVRDGVTGWLVRDQERIEDVVELALKELADPFRRAQIGSACRAWAATFDWDTSARQMANLIGTVASWNGRASAHESGDGGLRAG